MAHLLSNLIFPTSFLITRKPPHWPQGHPGSHLFPNPHFFPTQNFYFLSFHLTQGFSPLALLTFGRIVLCWGKRDCPVYCRVFTACLASTHWMPVAPLLAVTTKAVSRQCQTATGQSNGPWLKTTALEKCIHSLKIPGNASIAPSCP